MTALPSFLGHLRFSAACHAAGYPSRVPHLADSGWLSYSCGGRFAWGWGCLGTDVLLPHLFFYLVPAQLPLPLLPLWGSAPLAGASACLSPVGWSTPGVGLEGSLLRHLVFSHVPCSSSGPAACTAFPAAGYLGVFLVTGCLSFSFLEAWVRLQPFPSFSGLLLLRLLAGAGGVMHPVSGAPVAVVSAWFAGEVTLLPFPYLRVSVLLACGVSGVCGLRRRSRLPFMVRGPRTLAVGWSWYLLFS